VSEWSGPFEWTMQCDHVYYYPWSDSFEGSWPPACWTDYQIQPFGWDQSNYGAPHTGSQWAYCNLAGSELATPHFALPSPARLVFWYRVESAAFPQDLMVLVNGMPVYQILQATNSEYQEVQIQLGAYTGQMVSISFIGGTGMGGYDYGICLDDVMVRLNTLVWNGNNSPDWNDPGNWAYSNCEDCNPDGIPDTCDTAIIPSAPSGGHFPVIGSGVTAVCKSITLEPGATLMIAGDGSLDVKDGDSDTCGFGGP